MQRVSLEATEFDKIYLQSQQPASTNDAKLRTVKRALRGIIAEALTPKQRQYLTLYYAQKLNVNEIAEACNVHHTTVSRTLCRARENVEKRLKFYF